MNRRFIAGALVLVAIAGLLAWPLEADCGSVLFRDDRSYCDAAANGPRSLFVFIGLGGLVLGLYELTSRRRGPG